MSKKRKQNIREKLRKIQMKHQKTLETYRPRIEKIIAQNRLRKLRRSILITLSLIFILVLCFISALWYSGSNQGNPQENNQTAQQSTGSLSPYIYIWPDGKVEPSTAPISKVQEWYYQFTGNVSLPIIVLKDNIVIDGAGHHLVGTQVLGSRGIDVSYRNNVTIINLKIIGYDYAVYMDSTSRSNISNSEFTNNYCAVWLSRASFNHVTSNKIYENRGYALWMKNSTGNVISWNTITKHVNYTIYMGYSSNNTIKYNILANNRLSIFAYSSTGNTFTYNNITKNYEGIHLLYSSENRIMLNNIRENEIGIGSSESQNNRIYHNNFIGNTACVNIQNSADTWDDGSSKGNYWSDYIDKNPNAEEIDGVWNIPYIIDEKNQDRYPLTSPIKIKFI